MEHLYTVDQVLDYIMTDYNEEPLRRGLVENKIIKNDLYLPEDVFEQHELYSMFKYKDSCSIVVSNNRTRATIRGATGYVEFTKEQDGRYLVQVYNNNLHDPIWEGHMDELYFTAELADLISFYWTGYHGIDVPLEVDSREQLVQDIEENVNN